MSSVEVYNTREKGVIIVSVSDGSVEQERPVCASSPTSVCIENIYQAGI